MWKISKQFNFAYGHRVWVQELEEEFALDRKCVCRHLHGHEAEVHVHLQGTQLNMQGMVTDFLHLSWLKQFFDENVDHKFLIDRNDPLYGMMVSGAAPLLDVYVPGTGHVAGQIIDMDAWMNDSSSDAEREYYESFFVVKFIPTSENLSKWAFELATAKMRKLGVTVSEVEWWETPKSCSRYSEPRPPRYVAPTRFK